MGVQDLILSLILLMRRISKLGVLFAHYFGYWVLLIWGFLLSLLGFHRRFFPLCIVCKLWFHVLGGSFFFWGGG